MKKYRMWSVMAVICTFLFFILTGCELNRTSDEKLKDLDYTVCDEKRLPKALIDIINEKKEEPFKLTYRTKNYMYIVVGYGASDRTDVAVQMTQLYLADNAIFVDTDLKSVEETTIGDNMVSYPYIAVKCELYDKEVVFK